MLFLPLPIIILPRTDNFARVLRGKTNGEPMGEYQSFAQVYDLFMDNVDYEGWSRALLKKLRDRGVREGLVLDLGCGTGEMTERLAAAGYDLIGVDASPDMLEEAKEKQERSGHDILYLLQDMREFELYGTVRAVISCCDSLNYILEPEELLQVFRLVNNYLDPGGLFLFDFSTEVKYSSIGEDTIADSREEGSFIWDNYYDPEEKINQYDLTFFLKEAGGLYRKYEETHFQRAYSLDEIRELLEKAGLCFLEAWNDYTDNPPGPGSQRILVLAGEQGKDSISVQGDNTVVEGLI